MMQFILNSSLIGCVLFFPGGVLECFDISNIK